jgi:hypothetical protein
MQNIIIRKITAGEVESAMKLALEVFMEFEAPDYHPSGVETFKRDIIENADFNEQVKRNCSDLCSL